MQEMIKQKIDNYIIPITLMFVMGMMLFRVNDPFCLKTIFLLMLTFAVKPFGTYRWTLIDWSILIIWGYDIISCCVSINKYPSICFLQLSTNCFLAYHLVRYSFANTKERNLQKGFFGLSCVAVILSFFTFFFFYKNAHRAGFADLYPVRFLYKPLGFDTNSWNTILLCLLGIIGCQRKSKVGNVLVWGIVTLLLLSFSRSIYISLAALVFVLFVDLLGAEEKSRHIRLLLIFAFSLCAVVAFFNKEVKTTVSMHSTVSQQKSSQSRIHATVAAVHTCEEHPVFGVGNGNYTLATDARLNQNTNVPFTPFAPSWLMKLLVERGVVGTTFFLILGGGIVFFLFSRKNRQNRKFVGLVLTTILLKEMFQCTLFDNSISLTLLYVLLAIYMPRDNTKSYKMNSYDRLILPAVCCCAMLCFAYMKFWMPISKTSTAQLINKSICSINSYTKKKDDRLWKEAESNLLLAKKLQPQDVQIDFMLFELYCANGARQKALSYIRKLVEAYPNNALFQYKYYAYLEKLGWHTDAFKHLKIALRIYPKLITLKNIEKLRNRHRVFFSSKNLVLDTPISSEQDYARLGVLSFYLHDNKTAKEYCMRVSHSMPNLFMPWLVLYHIYLQEHNMVESEKCKRKFLLLSYGVIEQNLLQDESRFAIPHCKEHFLYNNYLAKFKLWYGGEMGGC